MSGKLIIIEGLDGSGKSTQLNLLAKRVQNARFISFPDYNSYSGRIITQYLDGSFGGLEEIDGAYSASSFYAIDRYINYKTVWGSGFTSGENIISARYVSSNLIYQMAKLARDEWDGYYNWLNDFEYNKLNLPKPTAVVFLDMPLEVSRRLLNERYKTNGGCKDLHEADLSFLEKCKKAADYAAQKENWININCAENNKPRAIEILNAELLGLVKDLLT